MPWRRIVVMTQGCFEKSPENVNEIFQLISRTPVGRMTLEHFLPYYHQQKTVIHPYPEKIIQKLRVTLGEGQPIGACFVINDQQGIIYLDFDSPLGVLAPFLVHEIVHSLDKGLWSNQDRPLSRKARDQLMLRAETKAFEYQHRFVQELMQRYPEYKKFIAKRQSQIKILINKLTQSDIAELYDLKSA